MSTISGLAEDFCSESTAAKFAAERLGWISSACVIDGKQVHMSS